jgi:hypothetical protein
MGIFSRRKLVESYFAIDEEIIELKCFAGIFLKDHPDLSEQEQQLKRLIKKLIDKKQRIRNLMERE